jgi:hypothetical protein
VILKVYDLLKIIAHKFPSANLIDGNRHRDVLQFIDAAPGDLEPGQVGCLGGALHGHAAVVVDVENHGFGVARQVAARLDLDLSEGGETGLSAFGALRIGTDLARDVGYLTEEVELALVELLGGAGELGEDAVAEAVEDVVQDDVLVLHVLVQVHVRLHVPDQLVGHNLGLFRDVLDELGDVAHLGLKLHTICNRDKIIKS